MTYRNAYLGLLAACVFASQVTGIGKIHNPDDVKRAFGRDYFRYDYSILGIPELEDACKKADFNSDSYETITLYRGWNIIIPTGLKN